MTSPTRQDVSPLSGVSSKPGESNADSSDVSPSTERPHTKLKEGGQRAQRQHENSKRARRENVATSPVDKDPAQSPQDGSTGLNVPDISHHALKIAREKANNLRLGKVSGSGKDVYNGAQHMAGTVAEAAEKGIPGAAEMLRTAEEQAKHAMGERVNMHDVSARVNQYAQGAADLLSGPRATDFAKGMGQQAGKTLKSSNMFGMGRPPDDGYERDGYERDGYERDDSPEISPSSPTPPSYVSDPEAEPGPPPYNSNDPAYVNEKPDTKTRKKPFADELPGRRHYERIRTFLGLPSPRLEQRNSSVAEYVNEKSGSGVSEKPLAGELPRRRCCNGIRTCWENPLAYLNAIPNAIETWSRSPTLMVDFDGDKPGPRRCNRLRTCGGIWGPRLDSTYRFLCPLLVILCLLGALGGQGLVVSYRVPIPLRERFFLVEFSLPKLSDTINLRPHQKWTPYGAGTGSREDPKLDWPEQHWREPFIPSGDMFSLDEDEMLKLASAYFSSLGSSIVHEFTSKVTSIVSEASEAFVDAGSKASTGVMQLTKIAGVTGLFKRDVHATYQTLTGNAPMVTVRPSQTSSVHVPAVTTAPDNLLVGAVLSRHWPRRPPPAKKSLWKRNDVGQAITNTFKKAGDEIIKAGQEIFDKLKEYAAHFADGFNKLKNSDPIKEGFKLLLYSIFGQFVFTAIAAVFFMLVFIHWLCRHMSFYDRTGRDLHKARVYGKHRCNFFRRIHGGGLTGLVCRSFHILGLFLLLLLVITAACTYIGWTIAAGIIVALNKILIGVSKALKLENVFSVNLSPLTVSDAGAVFLLLLIAALLSPAVEHAAKRWVVLTWQSFYRVTYRFFFPLTYWSRAMRKGLFYGYALAVWDLVTCHYGDNRQTFSNATAYLRSSPKRDCMRMKADFARGRWRSWYYMQGDCCRRRSPWVPPPKLNTDAKPIPEEEHQANRLISLFWRIFYGTTDENKEEHRHKCPDLEEESPVNHIRRPCYRPCWGPKLEYRFPKEGCPGVHHGRPWYRLCWGERTVQRYRIRDWLCWKLWLDCCIPKSVNRLKPAPFVEPPQETQETPEMVETRAMEV